MKTVLLLAFNNTRCLCGEREERTAIEPGIGPCGLVEPQSCSKVSSLHAAPPVL